MKIDNLKTEVQLRFGFGIILFLILISGILTWIQNDKLAQQINVIYRHPLTVQRALGDIKSNVLFIQIAKKNHNHNEWNLMPLQSEFESKSSDTHEKIDILFDRYLGPHSDIDLLHNYLESWMVTNNEQIRFIHSDKLDNKLDEISSISDHQFNLIIYQINKINQFARNKADEILTNSNHLQRQLKINTLSVIIISLIISLLIISIINKNINVPLSEINNAIHKIMGGNVGVRVKYSSNNQFGIISKGFNKMAQTIEKELILQKNVSKLAELMLARDEARLFSMDLLNFFITHTETQLAAIYILNDQKTMFEPFESIGVSKENFVSFSSDQYEGILGIAVASKKIYHLKNIPENNLLKFTTVEGKLFSRDIIILPIVSQNEVIALLYLASTNYFTKDSIRLIKNVEPIINTRIISILYHRKIVIFSDELELKNKELDAQKMELAIQSKELKQQNTELEIQKNELDEANRLKSNFLSNMSHELRTPLNSVIALSGVLSRRLKNQIAAEEYSYIEVIERNGKHLLEMINDVLDISRIESGKEEIELSKFEFNGLLKDLIYMIKPQAEQKNIQLNYHPVEKEIWITSDMAKCKHIFQNIIANALKFTEKGTIDLSTKINNEMLYVSIKDSGIGIHENHINHIFEEFRQADSSTSRKYGGTGLGLAIVSKLVNLLKGTVTVKSKLDEGSEFVVSLPVNRIPDTDKVLDEIKQRTDSSLKEENIMKGKTLLLIDDNQVAIIQIKDILEQLGFIVITAQNGEESLAVLRQQIPDGILLDLMMSGLDGFNVLQTISENDFIANIPVLILTAKHISINEIKLLGKYKIFELIQTGNVNNEELANTIGNMFCKNSTPKKSKNKIKDEKLATVLIAEDNPDNMATIKSIINEFYLILEAHNGFEAVSMTKKYLPDLILMDLSLPEIDGIEAFNRIRSDINTCSIPIIALTANSATDDLEVILAKGFNSFILKPFNQEILLRTIKKELYG